jgi:hypothetical protein
MNLRFDRMNRIRLVLLLFALVLVTGLASMNNSMLAGPRGGLTTTSPGGQGGAAPLAPSGAPPSSAIAGALPGDTNPPTSAGNGVIVGHSYKNDTSPPIRSIPPSPIKLRPRGADNENPPSSVPHKDVLDNVVQRIMAPFAMPTPILNFNGIPFPGVVCNCAPPDTNGEVGATQYVQIVNEGYQVFNKTTGASVLGPAAITTIWSGFGGVCETAGHGDPVVLYDQIANRWLISQFAGSPPTDECIAVSTSSDATGTYNRYGFHLGTNFFDYPHLSVWPDAYYMADNVFNSAGTIRLGPQPFAFDRTAMLAGAAATFVSTGITGGASEPYYLPADLDGSNLPPGGAPNSFVEWPGTGAYRVFHFHADFAVPANSTFTLFASPAAAGFTQLCPATRSCVPEMGGEGLDGLGDRFMFRAADRFFPDGHESFVTNYSVSAGGVAGVRWLELRNVTSGPVSVFQESTYQPDTTWRWMGSAAMDTQGNLALGFSASSASIFPQLRYAGRLVTDPVNTLAQGENTLFSGTGSQVSTSDRWGDYSDMTVDPVDDCTFWYTNEYYQTTSSFNWRTRIGNFKFPNCTTGPTNTPTRTVTGTPPTATSTPTNTRTSTPTVTPSPTRTRTSTNTPTLQFTATRTSTPTITPTNTRTNTSTNTPTVTPTNTPTNTSTNTPTSTFTPTFTDTPTPTSTPTNIDAFAHFSPYGPLTVSVGSQFTLDLLVNSGSNSVSAAQSYLTFTNSILQNVAVGSPGCGTVTDTVTADLSTFDVTLQNEVCNGPGQCTFRSIQVDPGSIAHASGAFSNPPASGDFRVAQAAFCAMAPGDAVLHWQFTPPDPVTRNSDIVDQNSNSVRNSTLYTDYVVHVIAAGNSLTGHVTLQGRPAQPSSLQSVPLTLTLRLASGGPDNEYSTTTDASGFFTVNVPTTGLYNWRVKTLQTLANSGTVSIAAGSNSQEMGLLRTGDASNDNVVNATDFSILKGTFGKSLGQVGYDARADFTGDDVVNAGDFTLLRTNFGLAGGGPIGPNRH